MNCSSTRRPCGPACLWLLCSVNNCVTSFCLFGVVDISASLAPLVGRNNPQEDESRPVRQAATAGRGRAALRASSFLRVLFCRSLGGLKLSLRAGLSQGFVD